MSMPNFDAFDRQRQASADQARAVIEEHRRELAVGRIAGRHARNIDKPLCEWTSADVMKAFANIAREAWDASRAAL